LWKWIEYLFAPSTGLPDSSPRFSGANRILGQVRAEADWRGNGPFKVIVAPREKHFGLPFFASDAQLVIKGRPEFLIRSRAP
jgi:hypothetical protein